MTPIKPWVPEGAKVYSFLYRTTDPEYLTQDVLAVSLPSGFYIDVGWFPEHDPEGCYVIRVFYQYWDDQKIPPIEVKTVDDVVREVEILANRFSRDTVATSSTHYTYITREPRPREAGSYTAEASSTSCATFAQCIVSVQACKGERVGA